MKKTINLFIVSEKCPDPIVVLTLKLDAAEVPKIGEDLLFELPNGQTFQNGQKLKEDLGFDGRVTTVQRHYFGKNPIDITIFLKVSEYTIADIKKSI